jgi:hypothetical protein
MVKPSFGDSFVWFAQCFKAFEQLENILLTMFFQDKMHRS